MSRRGPRIEHWGTQEVTWDLEEREPFLITTLVQPCRSLWSKDKGREEKLSKDKESWSSRDLCQIESNAFVRSKNTAHIAFLRSNEENEELTVDNEIKWRKWRIDSG